MNNTAAAAARVILDASTKTLLDAFDARQSADKVRRTTIARARATFDAAVAAAHSNHDAVVADYDAAHKAYHAAINAVVAARAA
jgi:ABC-type xylose transport system substrate-binding protein